VQEIAREGIIGPGGNNPFDSFSLRPRQAPLINDAGQAGFFAGLDGTTVNDSDSPDDGIFLSDSTGTLVQVARKGDPSPDGNSVFYSFGGLTLNYMGQTAFDGSLLETTGEANSHRGIFRSSDEDGLFEIAREGDPALVEDQVFGFFKTPSINDAGQVAFEADSAAPNFSSGLYLYDDTLGLNRVVGEGDPLLGSTIRQINFWDSDSLVQNARTGLNEAGQLAFRFNLADRRWGIAIWSPGISGDFNGDGQVDAIDYTVWRENLGADAGTLQNDTTGGTVGLAQFELWKANFATSSTAASLEESRVPEPNTLGIATLLLAALAARRRAVLAF